MLGGIFLCLSGSPARRAAPLLSLDPSVSKATSRPGGKEPRSATSRHSAALGWDRVAEPGPSRGPGLTPRPPFAKGVPKVSRIQNPGSDWSFVWKLARVDSPKISLSNKPYTNLLTTRGTRQRLVPLQPPAQRRSVTPSPTPRAVLGCFPPKIRPRPSSAAAEKAGRACGKDHLFSARRKPQHIQSVGNFMS